MLALSICLGVAPVSGYAGETVHRGVLLDALHDSFAEFPPIPCHMVNQLSKGELGTPAAAYSFPWRVVAEEAGEGPWERWFTWDDPQRCPEGQCLPNVYGSLAFKNIEAQSYNPGEKAYILPVYNFDGFTAHVGWVRFLAEQVEEDYIPEIHDEKFGRIRRAQTLSELMGAPGDTRNVFRDGLITPAKRCPNPVGDDGCKIVYEMCSNPKLLSYDARQLDVAAAILNADTFFTSYLVEGYKYEPNEAPTFYGWREFRDALRAADWQSLRWKLALIPIVGTVTQAHECLTSDARSLGCWWDAGLSAIGDASLGLAVFDRANKLRKIGSLIDGALAVGDAGQAAYYASQNRWPEAVVALASGGPELVGAVWLAIDPRGIRVTPPRKVDVSPESCVPRRSHDVKVISVGANQVCSRIRRTGSEILTPGNMVALLIRAGRSDAAGKALADAYPAFLAQLMSVEPLLPLDAAELARTLDRFTTPLGGHIALKDAMVIDEATIAAIRALPTAEQRAEAVIASFRASVRDVIPGGPQYSATGRTALIPSDLRVRRANGDIVTMSDCDIDDEVSRHYMREFNAAYAEEATHLIQNNVSTVKNDAGYPLFVHVFPEVHSFADWASTPAARDRLNQVTGITWNSIGHPFNTPLHGELDPLVILERSASTPEVEAYVRASVNMTSYPIRLGYAIWRHDTRGDFLGLSGPDFVQWIRTAKLLN
jgi:hypothetical protein